MGKKDSRRRRCREKTKFLFKVSSFSIIYTLEYRSTHEFLISESYQNQQSCAVSNYFGQRYFLDTTSFLKVVVLHFLPVVY